MHVKEIVSSRAHAQDSRRKAIYRLLDGQDDALDNDIMSSQSPRGGDGADVESLKAARPRREVDTPSIDNIDT